MNLSHLAWFQLGVWLFRLQRESESKADSKLSGANLELGERSDLSSAGGLGGGDERVLFPPKFENRCCPFGMDASRVVVLSSCVEWRLVGMGRGRGVGEWL